MHTAVSEQENNLRNLTLNFHLTLALSNYKNKRKLFFSLVS